VRAEYPFLVGPVDNCCWHLNPPRKVRISTTLNSCSNDRRLVLARQEIRDRDEHHMLHSAPLLESSRVNDLR